MVLSYVVLVLGVLVVAFPLYLTFVASTQTSQAIVQSPMPLLPGGHLIENYKILATRWMKYATIHLNLSMINDM